MGNIAPRWAKIASRCGNIGPTQSQRERERERETEKTEKTETDTDRDRDRDGDRDGKKERKIHTPGRSAPFHIE